MHRTHGTSSREHWEKQRPRETNESGILQIRSANAGTSSRLLHWRSDALTKPLGFILHHPRPNRCWWWRVTTVTPSHGKAAPSGEAVNPQKFSSPSASALAHSHCKTKHHFLFSDLSPRVVSQNLRLPHETEHHLTFWPISYSCLFENQLLL